MYDIHTHLYWQSYDADRDAVIARARAAGVDKMFAIGCTVEESGQCVELAEKYPEIYASVGIHPSFFNEHAFLCHSRVGGNLEISGDSGSPIESGMTVESLIRALKVLAKGKKVVAIGECGLEYYVHNQQTATNNQQKTISEEQKKFQKEGFVAQIALAEELGLPLIVHCRASSGSDDAYRDLLEILKAHSSTLKASVLHCYMGDTEVTREFLGLPNVSFSFTANITYPVKAAVRGTKNDLTETVKLVPLERMFAETDCPFLSPQVLRGERNEPANVVAVVEKVAELHGRQAAEVEQAIAVNFARVFPHA